MPVKSVVFLLGWLVASLALSAAACGGGNASPASDAGHEDGSVADAPEPDAAPDAATWDVAPHPPLPTAVDMGGLVLQNPKVHLIFFPGYQYQTQFEDFAQHIGELADGGETPYWTATTREYGIHALQYAGSTVLSGDAGIAPQDITDHEIDAFINSQLQAGTLGTPDPNTIYTIVYPQSTTIHWPQARRMGNASDAGDPEAGDAGHAGDAGPGDNLSCTDYGGSHDSTTIGSQHFVYAIIPTCANTGPLTGFDALSGPTSHEWVEAVTDPNPGVDNGQEAAYDGVDPNHWIWTQLDGFELGDLCQAEQDQYENAPDVGYVIQRTWSNQLALASHDPCAPNRPGIPYLAAAPVLPDTVTLSFPTFPKPFTTQGVSIGLAASKTIEVDVFSDGPTGAPATVGALDFASSQTPTLGFAWDQTTGSNGDKLHLTITVNTPARPAWNGAHPFVIYTSYTAGQPGSTVMRVWPGIVKEP
jgi:hypothetical protein